ncbi:MAG: hypothetical protein GY941_24515 [Planctomycetes bacterium]|nr:hypothetical protein [Planctomycetota bacterium]
MVRLARVVLPGHPHHITQRGNRRHDVFFRHEDYKHYLDQLKEWCGKEKIEVWTYCLMSNIYISLSSRTKPPICAKPSEKRTGDIHG